MIATPWTHTRWTDVNFLLEYLPLAVRFNVLSQQVQSTLRARARADSSAYEPRFIDAVGTYGEELNAQISRPMEAAEMIPLAEHNLQYLSVIAASITGNRNLGEGANAEVTALAQAEFEHTRLKPARSNIAIAT